MNISTIDGSIDGAIITPADYGSGYDPANPPRVLVEEPAIRYESEVSFNVNFIEGYTGTITGIEGVSQAGYNQLIFSFTKTPGYESQLITSLGIGDYIVVSGTTVGDGIEGIAGTSGANPSSVIGIGTQFLDCVYRVSNVSFIGQNTGTFTVNTSLSNPVTGINTTGVDLGTMSWGKINGITRDLDISKSFRTYDPVFTEDMRNFPSIVRTSGGLRDNGPISKQV